MAWIIRRARPFDRTPDSVRRNSNVAQCGAVVAIAGFESLGLWIGRLGRIVSAVGPMGEAHES